jgi:acyl-CoA synthetase (AMP-forming)/AMP-acid ligase II
MSDISGLTETTPLITLMTTRDGAGRHGSIGKLLPTFEARLVDTETGKDITDSNHAGELWVRGPSVMKGYYKNPEATEGTFAPDPKGRWFKTGDSATRDAGGFYRIADRLKELIKYKGFQGTSSVIFAGKGHIH